MTENQHVKDADKLIGSFNNLEKEYSEFGCDKGLISFCLSILNVDGFNNMNEIEMAVSDLKSICMVISRDLSSEREQEFNKVVRSGIDRIDTWLHAVYNHRLSPDDSEALFSNDVSISNKVKKASKKILRDDYFKFISLGTGKFDAGMSEAYIEEEDQKSFGVNILAIEAIDESNGKCKFDFNNNLAWTDRDVIWTGNKLFLESRLNAKYRKAKDKRLIGIMKSAYEKYGQQFLFKTILVEEKALDKPDKFEVVAGDDSNKAFLVIKRK